MNAQLLALEPGSWTELAGAVVTAAAVLVAYFGVRKAGRDAQAAIGQERDLTTQAIEVARDAHKLDRERWQVELREREMAQAARVSMAFEERDVGGNVVVVANDSPALITELKLFYSSTNQTWQEAVRDRRLSAGKPTVIDLPAELPNPEFDANRIGVSFRDNAGRYWARFLNGHLQQVPRTDPNVVLGAAAPWPSEGGGVDG